jgi:hypothetical protein
MIGIPLNYAGRLFLVTSMTGGKGATELGAELVCCCCSKSCTEQDRYMKLLQAEAEDGVRVEFIFCGDCNYYSLKDLLDRVKLADVAKALVAKIERDGAQPRQ